MYVILCHTSAVKVNIYKCSKSKHLVKNSNFIFGVICVEMQHMHATGETNMYRINFIDLTENNWRKSFNV